MNDIFTLYILKSEKVNKFYIGHTNNLIRRFSEHNSGQTKSTKAFVPWKIVFTQIFNSKSEAFDAELFLKKKKSKIYIEKLINGDVELPVARPDL